MDNRNLAVTNQKYCLICDWYDLKNTITEQLFRDTLNFVCSLNVLCAFLVFPVNDICEFSHYKFL